MYFAPGAGFGPACDAAPSKADGAAALWPPAGPLPFRPISSLFRGAMALHLRGFSVAFERSAA